MIEKSSSSSSTSNNEQCDKERKEQKKGDEKAKTDKLFPDLRDAVEAEDDNFVTEMESYCVNCGENGVTRMLLTEIPFFKQVVVISFRCEHCHFQNNELQPAQQIAARGVRYELRVENVRDLSRQVVKTEWAQLRIPEIEFEVKRQAGMITTVEGVLERAISGLEYSLSQSVLSQSSGGEEESSDTSQAAALRSYIDRMIELRQVRHPFTLIIEDISGNSFVENLRAPQADPQLTIGNFIRTIEDDKILGIYAVEENEEPDESDANEARKKGQNSNLRDEVLQFATNCPQCNAPCFTNMKVTQIPHFKEIVIMATNCDVCAHRTSEIKSCAGVEPLGVKIKIEILSADDLSRDVVRSDTCNVSVPELDLQLYSTGAGRYTTIQGLGLAMIDDLERSNPFIDGDSASSSSEDIRAKIDRLTPRLRDMIGLTIILDDPCGNSFVEGATDIERYERSWEQNEDLGINDMNTENYTADGKRTIVEEAEEEEEEEGGIQDKSEKVQKDNKSKNI